MAMMTEKLRAIMALDPDRTEIDFEGAEYSWARIAGNVRAMWRRSSRCCRPTAVSSR
jgi:hypothetical protein